MSRLRPLAGGTHATLLLALVAVGYLAVELTVLGVHVGLGWDEVVYVSQFSHHAPPVFFDAPRARGVTFLAAPVVSVTNSIVALRTWMALVSAAGLFGAFAVWLPVSRDRRVPLAAALFASLWVTLFYGQEVMPNYWVALGAVAGCGFLVRALERPSRTRYAAATACLGWAALVRPSDGLWLTVGLGAVLVASGHRRRIAAWGALVGGLLIGWVPWVVEAYVRFGGPIQRLHEASAENVGGLHFSLLSQMRAVNGPLLCRPCGAHYGYHPLGLLWWTAGAGLVVLGLVGRRGPQRLALAFPAAAAITLSAGYVMTIPYAAPRFLLPAYALLSLPAAAGALHLFHFSAARSRTLAAAAMAVAMLGQVGGQLAVADHVAVGARKGRATDVAVAQQLHDLGVRAPCALVGTDVASVAFASGCSIAGTRIDTIGPRPDPQVDVALHRELVVGVFRGHVPKGSYLHSWCTDLLPPSIKSGLQRWRVFLPVDRARCRSRLALSS